MVRSSSPRRSFADRTTRLSSSSESESDPIKNLHGVTHSQAGRRGAAEITFFNTANKFTESINDELSKQHVAHLEGPFPLSSELLLLLESSESDPDSLSDSSEDVSSASSSSSSLLLPPRSQNLDACNATQHA